MSGILELQVLLLEEAMSRRWRQTNFLQSRSFLSLHSFANVQPGVCWVQRSAIRGNKTTEFWNHCHTAPLLESNSGCGLDHSNSPKKKWEPVQARSRRFDAFETTSCSEASLFSSTDTSTCTNLQCFMMYTWYAVGIAILSLKRWLQAWHDPSAKWRLFFKALRLPPATNVQMQLAECRQS